MYPTNFMMRPVKMTVVPARKEAKPKDARDARASENRPASAVGFEARDGNARRARRAGGSDAANRRRRARVHPRAERLRKVHVDQNHYARMLSVGERWII